MKNILISIFLLLSLSLNAQTKLNQIEPFKIGGIRQDSGMIITNSQGVQYYIHYDSLFKNFMVDCDAVEGCLDSGTFFCEQVLECLDDGALCEALNNFTDQTLAGNGKLLWIDSTGACHKFTISSLPGFGWNCDSVQNCLESGLLCEVLNDLDTGTITIGSKVLFINGDNECLFGDIGDITGTFNCDSVLLCLNDGALCDAIGQFPMGVPADGDYVAIWNEDGCKLISIDSLGGGMDSLNCEAVLACVTDTICGLVEDCLSDGLLCEQLQALALSDATTGINLIGVVDDECVQINWDSLNAECQVEIEVGEFGLNPDGCDWATTCDGGATHSNRFYASLELDGNTLELHGNAEGGQTCLMSDVDLTGVLDYVDSIWITTSGCQVTLNYRKGGANFAVTIPSMFYGVSAPSGGTYTFTPQLTNSSICASFQICVCDETAGCSGVVNGTCGVPLVGGEEVIHTGSSKSIQNIYAAGIPEYKSKKAALKDCELQKGDIYIVKGSDKIRFKR